MAMRKKFRASKAQKEVLLTVDDLRTSAFQVDKEGRYDLARRMLRIADRLYNQVMLDSLAYTLELS